MSETLFCRLGMTLPIPQSVSLHSKKENVIIGAKKGIICFLLRLRCHYNLEGCNTILVSPRTKNHVSLQPKREPVK